MKAPLLAVALGVVVGHSGLPHAIAQTAPPAAAVRAAREAGVPERFAGWTLARYVPGEHGHFLYTSGKRALSLFVTDTGHAAPLTVRDGWTATKLPDGRPAFLHADARNPARAAIAFKTGKQRRILVGRLSPDERIALAAKL